MAVIWFTIYYPYVLSTQNPKYFSSWSDRYTLIYYQCEVALMNVIVHEVLGRVSTLAAGQFKLIWVCGEPLPFKMREYSRNALATWWLDWPDSLDTTIFFSSSNLRPRLLLTFFYEIYYFSETRKTASIIMKGLLRADNYVETVAVE